MKKVLIFYGSYGGGHLSAARSIKEYIDTNYKDTETCMVDCIEYINKALNKVTTKAYSEMAKNAHWVWKKVYYGAENGPFSRLNDKTQKLLSIKLNKILQTYKPDLIISTHPFSSHMCAILKKKKKINTKIATVITDYAPHSQWLMHSVYIDYFFVAHDGMKEDLLKRGIKEKQIKVTGIPLSNRFLAHYNKEKILSEFNLSPDKRTVLFFAGGEQGFGKDKIFNMLKSIIETFPNLQVIAISGKNEKMKQQFDDLVSKTNSDETVKVLKYTNKIPELMSVSDLVITKPGGLTTTESLASGLPIIVINPIPGQEEENAEFLEQKGVAIWIRKNDNIEDELYKVLNSEEKLQSMKINARLLAKKNSTKDICEILLGKL